MRSQIDLRYLKKRAVVCWTWIDDDGIHAVDVAQEPREVTPPACNVEDTRLASPNTIVRRPDPLPQRKHTLPSAETVRCLGCIHHLIVHCADATV